VLSTPPDGLAEILGHRRGELDGLAAELGFRLDVLDRAGWLLTRHRRGRRRVRNRVQVLLR
jgi:hypothetical protein